MKKHILKIISHFKVIVVLIILAYSSTLYAETVSDRNFKATQAQIESQARSEVEEHRKEAEKNAKDAIVKEAVVVIEETKKAINFIQKKQNKEALEAIERATGKTDILVARYPKVALLPVEYKIEVIDVAPSKPIDIRNTIIAARAAFDNIDYPNARLLLYLLRSELDVKTYSLPLATYPDVLKDAVRLLEEHKDDEASTILINSLNTLVVINKVFPLPIINAEVMLKNAEAKHEKDRDTALRLLATAKQELQRARELGYVGKDPEYASINKSIEDLEKRIKSKQNSASAFATLKNKVKAFLQRHSEGRKHVTSQ
ncbi:MAG: YfdX family protein [Candidatus Amoebophilus sp.]